jgi:hypothetical protein
MNDGVTISAYEFLKRFPTKVLGQKMNSPWRRPRRLSPYLRRARTTRCVTVKSQMRNSLGNTLESPGFSYGEEVK